MKMELVSVLSVILGILIIAFPIMGVIAASDLIGLALLLIAIILLITGVSIMDYNTSGAILDYFLGIVMLIVSLIIIFNPNFFPFLAEILLYLGGIFLIIVGVVALINNRQGRFGFWIGIAGILLGVVYIVVGTYISDPIVLGTLIGIWLIISGILKFLDR